MSKAKMAKFAGKQYIPYPAKWTVEDNAADMNFAAEDEVALYVIAVQLAYNTEDKTYTCFAEFFKVPMKKIDYKAYQIAKKDVDSYKDDEEDGIQDEFPSYTEKQWKALLAGEKFDLLEPFLDVDSDFDIDEENFEKFVAKMKDLGIEIPASLKNDLKK